MSEHESWKKLKLVEIHQALNSDPIRRKVWPKLLCINVYKLPILWLSLQTQFCSLPLYPGMHVDERHVLQEHLIDSILQKNPGYHDILVTFLLVVGERMAIAMVGTIFALSWLITWYGHVLSEFHHVLRLYDFFLASHPLMAVYFAAVIVLHREKEVKQTECDMSMVYHLQIPQDLPYEKLITQAHCLFTLYLPSLLAISPSVSLQHHHQLFQGLPDDHSASAARLCPPSAAPSGPSPRQRGPRLPNGPARDTQPNQAANQLVKMAVWGISATLWSAALAVAQTALDWAPDFFMQLYCSPLLSSRGEGGRRVYLC
uniref:Zgc:63863 n=1 Tax=Hucho hucho TaxID=62062 RepID=A0A4W5MWU3_9TELE